MTPTWDVILGDCVEEMARMDECSIDAVVCDPPYGLEFMGKEWDRLGGADVRATDDAMGAESVDAGRTDSGGVGGYQGVHTGERATGQGVDEQASSGGGRGRLRGVVNADDWNQGQSNAYSRARIRSGQGASYGIGSSGRAMQAWHEAWAREALRVLKPGGYLLAAGGSRTYHRLTSGIEDAGFEIRDCITHMYGSGFPKSSRVSRDPRFCQCGEAERNGEYIDPELPRFGHTDTAAGAGDDGLPPEDVLRSSRTLSDSLDDCPQDRGSGDEPVPLASAGDQALSQPRADALGRIRSREPVDAQASVRERSPSLAPHSDHPSKPDSLGPPESDELSHSDKDLSKRFALRIDSGSESRAFGIRRTDEFPSALPHCTVCGKPDAKGRGTALKPAAEFWVVARRPLAGTVAANVLAFDTGALNIDATRIGTTDALGGGAEKRVAVEGKHEGWSRPWMNDQQAVAAHTARVRDNVQRAEALGRWPANVVFSHSPGCRAVGTRKVEPIGATAHKPHHGKDDALIRNGRNDHAGYRDADGTETVASYECVPGCPIRQLDEQTGVLDGCGGPKQTTHDAGMFGIGQPGRIYSDSGSASRFFASFEHQDEPRFLYQSKASSAERNAGLNGFDAKFAPTMNDGIGGLPHSPPEEVVEGERVASKRNVHPLGRPSNRSN